MTGSIATTLHRLVAALDAWLDVSLAAMHRELNFLADALSLGAGEAR